MDAFLGALLNAWWQGIVLTLLVWLVLRDLPRVSAATRVAIWHVTLLAVLLLPVLQRIPWPSWQVEKQRGPAVMGPASTAAIEPIAAAPPPLRRPIVELSQDDGFEVLVAVSIALVFLQLLRLSFGYWAVRRLKRKARRAGIAMPVALARPVDVLVSERIGMPMAVGYRRPAILLPRAMAERLTPEQLRHVLLHESAHLRRHDDWLTLGERLLRAIFFFQPAVHAIGRQIDREREIACDDWVIAQQAGAVKPYAASLARVAELGSPGRRAPMLATGAGRPKEIFRRLDTLLDRTRNRMPGVSEPVLMMAGLALLLAVWQAFRSCRSPRLETLFFCQ